VHYRFHHIMQEVERLCDHVVIVAGGRNAEGTVTQLKQLSDIRF
jgi:ABC-type uncharacterized transport system ATPase subunit